jgi:2-oxoglutarate ferredoxin oxidoreductase subunit delta
MRFTEHINSRGFHPAYLADPESCTGCAQCALMCPDACIRILRSGDG